MMAGARTHAHTHTHSDRVTYCYCYLQTVCHVEQRTKRILSGTQRQSTRGAQHILVEVGLDQPLRCQLIC